MKHKGTITLNTERLKLRRIYETDAQEMFDNYANDERVTKFLSWTPHGNVENTKALLSSWMSNYERLDFYHWAIIYKDNFVGSISCIDIDEKNEHCELGYCIAYDYWGKGITAEALNAIIKFLFNEVLIHRIMAKHDTENPNSGIVMQKCGMKYEGTMKDYYKRDDGTFGDSKIYGLLKSERKEVVT